MSKGGGSDQGPAASSFESPSKTGWLYKHGGSGMSSHWRKRWFVADHHYLFYYKGPNDKKPVGIVCLPEYESCHRTEAKVWKKQNSFMLDRGNATQEHESPEGAAAKNYVMYADSEEEMLEWIKALTEEIKPMIGENRYANGFGGGKTGSSKGGGAKQKKGKGDTVAVDDKALNEVTAMAGEGPKLTHLTTSRPKVPRGRRPPKRYAVFHEDDSNPESPSDTPDPIKTSETPPSPTPGESPLTQRKKGHKPTAPILPSANKTLSAKALPKTPPTPPAKVVKQETPDLNNAVEPESPTTSAPQKLKFAKPLPPKKPAKEKPEVPTAEPSELPSPSGVQRPTPPAKPTKDAKEEKMDAVPVPESVTKPSPVKKPRPQPPVKRRTTNPPAETTASTAQVTNSAPQPARPTPAPRPAPRKRTSTHQQESPSREPAQVVKEMAVVKEEAKPSIIKETAVPVEDTKAPTTPTTTPTATPIPTPAALEAESKPTAMEEVSEQEMKESVSEEQVKQVQQVEEAANRKEAAVPVATEEPVIPEKLADKELVLAKEEDIKPLPDISEDKAVASESAEEKLPEKREDKEIVEVESTTTSENVEDDKRGEEDKKEEEGKKGEETQDKELLDTETDNKEKEEIVDDELYVDVEMGEESEGCQKSAEVKKDDEYEVMNFDGSQEGTESETKKELTETAAEAHQQRAAAETHQQRVVPGKVHQYDEVAGDFLPHSSSEGVAMAPHAQQRAAPPGKVNQYDEVAGDFLPLNFSKPKVTSPSSASSREGGPVVVGGARVPPGYEVMKPAGAALVVDQVEQSSQEGDYMPMQDGVIVDKEDRVDSKISTEKYEYVQVGEWTSKDSPLPQPLEYSNTDHHVPKTLISSSSQDNTCLSPEINGRQSVASSSGSTTSDGQFHFSPVSPSKGKARSGSGNELMVASLDSEEGRRRGSSGASRKSGDGSASSQLHRDSLGYTRIKEDRTDRVNSVASEYDRLLPEMPPEVIPIATSVGEDIRLPVPETLQQAKEILRLAKVVKAEAEQMREEARKELTLAKKDRRDAMLMKKNAAEILRMAKERLGSSTK